MGEFQSNSRRVPGGMKVAQHFVRATVIISLRGPNGLGLGLFVVEARHWIIFSEGRPWGQAEM